MDALVRLRWSRRGAPVKSRGSKRREGTQVRSTASPFARQVEGGPWDTRRGGASPGFRFDAPSDKGVRPDSSRPLVPRAEAWSSRSDRRSGSSTPSRVTGAPPPAAFDGRRRRSHVGVRGNGSLSGVLDLHEGLQKSSGESDSSDSHGDGRRSGSSKAGIVHAIRREAIRKGASEESRFACESVEQAASPREP
jgi:hypothetical protein